MKTLIAYNNKSGHFSFERIKNEIIPELNKYKITDISLYSPTGPRVLNGYIEEHASEYELLIIFGGDGTLNEAVNGLMRITKRPRVLYVPTGTANDVGHMLGLKKDFKKCFKLLEQEPVKMDICQMNDEYFVYTAGSGKLTGVSYNTHNAKAKRRFGVFYYYWVGLKEFFSRFKMNIKVKSPDDFAEGTYYLMLLLNSQRVASFPIHKKRKVKLNDNEISLLLFNAKKFLATFSMVRYFLFGDYLKYGIKEMKGNHFEIESEEPMQMNQDGEKSMLEKKITIDVHHLALEIYVSSKSIKKYF